MPYVMPIDGCFSASDVCEGQNDACQAENEAVSSDSTAAAIIGGVVAVVFMIIAALTVIVIVALVLRSCSATNKYILPCTYVIDVICKFVCGKTSTATKQTLEFSKFPEATYE